MCLMLGGRPTMHEYIIAAEQRYDGTYAVYVDDNMGITTGNPALRGEVVRCRDCKHSRIKYTAKGALKSASCSWHGRCIKPDGYCAWGERASDD